jgi:hypothetical protein
MFIISVFGRYLETLEKELDLSEDDAHTFLRSNILPLVLNL